LIDYLLAGQVQPGQRIPSERNLSESLGVGRSVVREALKSITMLGLVEVRQGDGTYLKSTESDLLPQAIEWGLLLGAKRTRDLVEARRHLEVILAGLAAERRDDAALAELRDLLDVMHASRKDPDGFVAADMAFHLRIAEAAGNETLFRVMSSVRSLLLVWMTRVGPTVGLGLSADEHDPIYRAIEAGDVAGARTAMAAHMDWAVERLEETLVQSPHV
jgi:GntR family transcriptional repressor for pyruvate dehydrogenase complex